jgi:iron complex transport system substrate-binding protein
MTRPASLQNPPPWHRLVLLLWILSGLTAQNLAATERPQRVVSVNLCSDQLLLMLADADQVASVSHLAVEPLSSFVAERARNYPLNHARAEEVIALRPDLVLASSYGKPRLLTTLESLGYRVERLPPAHDLAQIVHNIRQLASLLHQPERGETLIRTLQRRLGDESDAPQDKRPGALFLQPRGYTSGRETLQDEALRLAGWRNLAAEQGIEGYAPVDLERLLRWQPQRIFTSVYDGSGNSLAQRQLLHPALSRLLAGRPLEPIPFKYWICPGPMLAEAVELLRQAKSELKPPRPNADTTP